MSISSDEILQHKNDFTVESDQKSKEDGTGATYSHEEDNQGDNHLSIGAVLRGQVAHELTPFERKAALINS